MNEQTESNEKCSICQEEMISQTEDLIELPCRHKLHIKCCQSLWEKRQSPVVRCAICRVKIPEEFFESKREIAAEDLCQGCDENEIRNICWPCKTKLCKTCSKTHEKALKNHKVISILDFMEKQHKEIKLMTQELFCETHMKAITNFCRNCRKDICSECIDDHSCHEIVSLKKANEMENAELNKLLMKIDRNIYIGMTEAQQEEVRKEEAKKEETNLLQKVNDEFDAKIEILYERREKMNYQIKEEFGEKMKASQKRMKEIQELENYWQNMKGEIEAAKKYNSLREKSLKRQTFTENLEKTEKKKKKEMKRESEIFVKLDSLQVEIRKIDSHKETFLYPEVAFDWLLLSLVSHVTKSNVYIDKYYSNHLRSQSFIFETSSAPTRNCIGKLLEWSIRHSGETFVERESFSICCSWSCHTSGSARKSSFKSIISSYFSQNFPLKTLESVKWQEMAVNDGKNCIFLSTLRRKEDKEESGKEYYDEDDEDDEEWNEYEEEEDEDAEEEDEDKEEEDEDEEEEDEDKEEEDEDEEEEDEDEEEEDEDEEEEEEEMKKVSSHCQKCSISNVLRQQKKREMENAIEMEEEEKEARGILTSSVFRSSQGGINFECESFLMPAVLDLSCELRRLASFACSSTKMKCHSRRTVHFCGKLKAARETGRYSLVRRMRTFIARQIEGCGIFPSPMEEFEDSKFPKDFVLLSFVASNDKLTTRSWEDVSIEIQECERKSWEELFGKFEFTFR